MFTKQDGTTINMEDRKDFKYEKMLKFTHFVTFKELQEETAF